MNKHLTCSEDVLLSMNSPVAAYNQLPELLAENNNNNNHSESNSAEKAALPPTYAALPTTKLDEEPNPFEQSFEGATMIKKHALPNVQSMDYPTTLNAIKSDNQWDSLKSGILSPSMLTGPVERAVDTQIHPRHVFNNNNNATKGPKRNNSKEPEDEEKRKNFLERNRIAALKCRQRKKLWLQNLQTKVQYLAADNEQYRMQVNALSEEVIQLKTMLMAHKDCPIDQQAMQAALSRPIPGVSSKACFMDD